MLDIFEDYFKFRFVFCSAGIFLCSFSIVKLYTFKTIFLPSKSFYLLLLLIHKKTDKRYQNIAASKQTLNEKDIRLRYFPVIRHSTLLLISSVNLFVSVQSNVIFWLNKHNHQAFTQKRLTIDNSWNSSKQQQFDDKIKKIEKKRFLLKTHRKFSWCKVLFLFSFCQHRFLSQFYMFKDRGS